MPLDLSTNKSLPEEHVEVKRTVKDIVQVFRDSIRNALEVTPSTSTGPKTRLAHHTYGEVLSSEESLERLKQAEEKKATKRPNVGCKRGRPKENKLTEKE